MMTATNTPRAPQRAVFTPAAALDDALRAWGRACYEQGLAHAGARSTERQDGAVRRAHARLTRALLIYDAAGRGTIPVQRGDQVRLADADPSRGAVTVNLMAGDVVYAELAGLPRALEDFGFALLAEIDQPLADLQRDRDGQGAR